MNENFGSQREFIQCILLFIDTNTLHEKFEQEMESRRRRAQCKCMHEREFKGFKDEKKQKPGKK